MPAPDLLTIFDVEAALEDAVKAVLATYDLPPGLTSRETGNLPAERIDIQFALGACQGHKSQITPGQYVRDAWTGRLTLNLWTRRIVQTEEDKPEPVDPSLHGRIRAQLRIACEYFAGKFDATVLPYHVLTSIVHAGTDPTVNVEDDCDLSALHYDCLVSVRSGSWPA